MKLEEKFAAGASKLPVDSKSKRPDDTSAVFRVSRSNQTERPPKKDPARSLMEPLKYSRSQEYMAGKGARN